MPNISRDVPALATRQEHLFVNNIRHWAMFAIIFMHCAMNVLTFGKAVPMNVYVLLAIAKFGTIAFFLISGFLLGERFGANGRMNYLKRRIATLAIPWSVWSALFTAMILIHRRNLFAGGVPSLLWSMYDGLTISAYWFVPNIVVALSVLLVCARWIDSWKFGAATFGISLFYGVNVYEMWLPTAHSTALLGFMSYLWLGAWASRNWQKVKTFIDALPVWLLVFSALVFCALSIFETYVLRGLGSRDTLNTLRLSNQGYSVVIVLLFLKVKRVISPWFVDARRHTYGLYLSHTPILAVITLVMRKATARVGWQGTALSPLMLALMMFAFSYATSLSVTRFFASRPELCWIVGAAPKASASQQRFPSLQVDELKEDHGDKFV